MCVIRMIRVVRVVRMVWVSGRAHRGGHILSHGFRVGFHTVGVQVRVAEFVPLHGAGGGGGPGIQHAQDGVLLADLHERAPRRVDVVAAHDGVLSHRFEVCDRPELQSVVVWVPNFAIWQIFVVVVHQHLPQILLDDVSPLHLPAHRVHLEPLRQRRVYGCALYNVHVLRRAVIPVHQVRLMQPRYFSGRHADQPEALTLFNPLRQFGGQAQIG
mmetsp:Transcript_31893/g.70265  ORF Transcript_31893/g.70265 Transcript_31893/m.70265 type:complete len:214 (-) Transcript_31893:424-1065(-)